MVFGRKANGRIRGGFGRVREVIGGIGIVSMSLPELAEAVGGGVGELSSGIFGQHSQVAFFGGNGALHQALRFPETIECRLAARGVFRRHDQELLVFGNRRRLFPCIKTIG